MEWNSPPTYDSDIKDEDLVNFSLSHDREKDSIVDYDTYLDEKESLEKVNLLDTIDNFANESFTHHVLDKSPEDKIFDLSVAPINYVDFIMVDVKFF
jgi:hypothetical protein